MKKSDLPNSPFSIHPKKLRFLHRAVCIDGEYVSIEGNADSANPPEDSQLNWMLVIEKDQLSPDDYRITNPRTYFKMDGNEVTKDDPALRNIPLLDFHWMVFLSPYRAFCHKLISVPPEEVHNFLDFHFANSQNQTALVDFLVSGIWDTQIITVDFSNSFPDFCQQMGRPGLLVQIGYWIKQRKEKEITKRTGEHSFAGSIPTPENQKEITKPKRKPTFVTPTLENAPELMKNLLGDKFRKLLESLKAERIIEVIDGKLVWIGYESDLKHGKVTSGKKSQVFAFALVCKKRFTYKVVPNDEYMAKLFGLFFLGKKISAREKDGIEELMKGFTNLLRSQRL